MYSIGYISYKLIGINSLGIGDIKLSSISSKSPLWSAVLELEKIEKQQLLVFNNAGLPIGTIDKVDLGEAVLNKLGLKLPKDFLNLARKKNIYPLGISLSKVVNEMISADLINQSQFPAFCFELYFSIVLTLSLHL